MTTTGPERPQLAAFFKLTIDGVDAANFSECTGLARELGVEEYPEGGENRFVHRFPVRGASPNLVLTRGLTSSDALWDWYAESQHGPVKPRAGQVDLFARDGSDGPVRTWRFERGYPLKVSGPDLSAMTSAIALESIEIVHHGLTLVSPRRLAPLGV